ncbi:GNAT family N-acetyltransferase [uncultured Cocleimonas sp.]|uniref:GNAT family N-acetyltransferase n=1 Tax=uncultured Cocleimonas sp. TaxID=1051587 RepID=UPI00260E0415|nr:GNAT family N-acetyltransferase [uncultured Cocleimonas sp.]
MQAQEVRFSAEKAEVKTTALSNRVSIISKTEEFFTLRNQWNAINESSPKGTVFVSWEWLYTWWETYAKDGNRQLYILTCTNNRNQIIGIAPFQIINNPKKYFPCSRQLILLGTGETDGSYVFGEYMDLIIQQGQEQRVIDCFSSFLTKNNDLWDGMKFHELLENSYLSRLFSTQIKDGSFNIIKETKEKGFRTYIDLPETYKDYLMGLRKKMRNNITRSFSRLESEQNYSIDIIDDEAKVNESIEILAELNRSRRGDMKKHSVFEQENFVKFHRRVIKRLLPKKQISFKILHFGEQPVAALYSFIDGDTIHPYQSGFETENGHRYSLLTTMLSKEIESSINNPQLTRFNFMYSDEEGTYKKRYSGTTEIMYSVSYDKTGFKYSLYQWIHGSFKQWVKKLLRV